MCKWKLSSTPNTFRPPNNDEPSYRWEVSQLVRMSPGWQTQHGWPRKLRNACTPCAASRRKTLQRTVNPASKIIGAPLLSIEEILHSPALAKGPSALFRIAPTPHISTSASCLQEGGSEAGSTMLSSSYTYIYTANITISAVFTRYQ